MRQPGTEPHVPAGGRTCGGWVGFPLAQEDAWLPMARLALATMQAELAKAE